MKSLKSLKCVEQFSDCPSQIQIHKPKRIKKDFFKFIITLFFQKILNFIKIKFDCSLDRKLLVSSPCVRIVTNYGKPLSYYVYNLFEQLPWREAEIIFRKATVLMALIYDHLLFHIQMKLKFTLLYIIVAASTHWSEFCSIKQLLKPNLNHSVP